MEDTIYQFGSENINLTDGNINDGDCTAFVTDHEESACKRLVRDEDFQTIDHEHFSDVNSFPDLNSRTTEIEEGLKIVYDSSTTVCSSDLQYNKEYIKDFQDCRIVNRLGVKKESSTEVGPQPKPSNRRGAQLIRLRVAPHHSEKQSRKVEADVDTQKDNISSAQPQEINLENKKFELTEISEKSDFQFVAPKVPAASQKQIFELRSSEDSSHFGGTKCQDIIHSESVNIPAIPSTNQASIVIIDETGSDFISPRTKEFSPNSPNIAKTPVLEGNSSLSRSSNDVSNDSIRVNSSSSFPYIQDLSGTVSSDDQSSTSTHGSDFYACKAIQRFITSDNQVVYGYKDTFGEFHYVSQGFIDKQSHNEKERFRRSRVSGACGALRTLVPGLTDRTDKATVFERSALYLTFLRDKFQSQFDQSYREKYFAGGR